MEALTLTEESRDQFSHCCSTFHILLLNVRSKTGFQISVTRGRRVWWECQRDMDWMSPRQFASHILLGKTNLPSCRRLRFHPWVGKLPWRRKGQPTTLLLAWRIPWTEEPGRLLWSGPQVCHVPLSFSSVTQLCSTLCDPKDCSTPGFLGSHQLSKLAQTHTHLVNDVIQPFYPLSSPSPPAFNLSQHQGLSQ